MDSNLKNQLLTDIISRTDMAALVGRYTTVVERSGHLVAHCPFHTHEQGTTTSLVIDPTLHYCFCLDCDKQWGPIDFLIEAEQLTYAESVAHLAAEAGLTLPADWDEDNAVRQPELPPSALFEANRYALRRFHHNLLSTQEGRDIGLAYFRERGVNDEMIERFTLGYALEGRSPFADAARADGISPAAMEQVGLAVSDEHGSLRDRYRGRVIFPVFTVSGEPVAFGARTLRTSKDVAKYVNSPESAIYSKSVELYGLWQAREEITRVNRCILVEGYLDVISMHQAGLTNVVAASGTSLTEGQVSLLGRFTNRVTVIFDADAAGIKASLRSIDMLLGADMEIDIVSLPEGEDPDSYARSHSREEIESYLADHAIDFIEFKLSLARDKIRRDPIERARVVADIISSIAAVPHRGRMRTMLSRTAFLLNMSERTLAGQLLHKVNERLERRHRTPHSTPQTGGMGDTETDSDIRGILRPKEEELLGYVIRNALLYFCDTVEDVAEGEEPHIYPTNTIEYIAAEMERDSIGFSNPDLATLFNEALRLSRLSTDELMSQFEQEADRVRDEMIETERQKVLERAADLRTIEREEKLIEQKADELWDHTYQQLCGAHVVKGLLAVADPEIRQLATRLLRPAALLSKIHTRHGGNCESEQDRLFQLVTHALCTLKATIVRVRIDDITRRLRSEKDPAKVSELLTQRMTLDRAKTALAPFIGDRVLT